MEYKEKIKNLKARLECYSSIKISDVNLKDLKDVRDVQIDTSRPVMERVLIFWNQMGNPYIFKVDDTIVKVSFTESGPTLQEGLVKLFTRNR